MGHLKKKKKKKKKKAKFRTKISNKPIFDIWTFFIGFLHISVDFKKMLVIARLEGAIF